MDFSSSGSTETAALAGIVRNYRKHLKKQLIIACCQETYFRYWLEAPTNRSPRYCGWPFRLIHRLFCPLDQVLLRFENAALDAPPNPRRSSLDPCDFIFSRARRLVFQRLVNAAFSGPDFLHAFLFSRSRSKHSIRSERSRRGRGWNREGRLRN